MFSRSNSTKQLIILAVTVVTVLLLAACRGANVPAASGQTPPAGQAAAVQSPTTAPSATPQPTPSATPEPLAVRVNGEGISLAEYNAELAQVQEAHQALGKTATLEEQSKLALDNLIDTLLLAQGAAENGYSTPDGGVESAVSALAQQMGGEQAVADWAARQGYDDHSFRAALARQMAAAWQRDRIAAAVPTEAEQVHVRQILTIDPDIARRALEYVQIPGTNFAAYAYQYDLQAGGDLGWFPRGFLTQPAVEEAAFKLQPGEISPVIESEVGYHILQLIAREPSRPITPDARRVLQHKAIQDWLAEQRKSAQVEMLLP